MNDAISAMMVLVFAIDVLKKDKYLISKFFHISLNNRIGDFVEFCSRSVVDAGTKKG
jgi:hypothetical protein